MRNNLDIQLGAKPGTPFTPLTLKEKNKLSSWRKWAEKRALLSAIHIEIEPARLRLAAWSDYLSSVPKEIKINKTIPVEIIRPAIEYTAQDFASWGK